MQPSVIGFIVCIALYGATRLMGGSVLVALMASIPFGSTAIATLPSLGGSSPLIFTVFSVLLLATVAMRQSVVRDIGRAYGLYPTFWLVTLLMVYAVVSSVFLPRLFAGQTSAFIPTTFGVQEVALAPVSGNISQTGYFLLGGMAFAAVSLLMLRGMPLSEVRRAYFAWAFLHAAMGAIDLAGKMAGAGDIMEPIRTASYAMLTEVSHSGFWRIVGGQSEASAFAGVGLSTLCFSYVYWRRTASQLALGLTLTLLILLILSTSSTAYAGLAVLSIPVGWSIVRSLGARRLQIAELILLGGFALCFMALLTVMVVNPRFFDPFLNLLDATLVNKLETDSGQERTYWNYKSLQSVIDTGGLGIGFGSSRASSWLIAVVSQMGVTGAVLMGLLVLAMTRESRAFRLMADPETRAIVAATRAAAFGGLLSATMVGGSADPGPVFFITLAVTTCVQARYAHVPAVPPATAGGAGAEVVRYRAA